jgi:hypothetical protein
MNTCNYLDSNNLDEKYEHLLQDDSEDTFFDDRNKSYWESLHDSSDTKIQPNIQALYSLIEYKISIWNDIVAGDVQLTISFEKRLMVYSDAFKAYSILGYISYSIIETLIKNNSNN